MKDRKKLTREEVLEMAEAVAVNSYDDKYNKEDIEKIVHKLFLRRVDNVATKQKGSSNG